LRQPHRVFDASVRSAELALETLDGRAVIALAGDVELTAVGVVEGAADPVVGRHRLEHTAAPHDGQGIADVGHDTEVATDRETDETTATTQRVQGIENSAWIETSRVEVGSSSSSTSGSRISARAIATRVVANAAFFP
jgi:hypothetical protein